MTTPPRLLIAAGVILGGITWLALPLFLPLLMQSEGSSGKSTEALLYVLTGPALVLPWTLLGIRRPGMSSRLFLLSAIVNLVTVWLWVRPLSDNPAIKNLDDVLGICISLLLPGPLLLLVFGGLFARAKSRTMP